MSGSAPPGRLPIGWRRMTKLGKVITGTQIVSFKAPLRVAITRQLPQEEHFTIDHVLAKFPNLGLIIDLTKTTRYYEDAWHEMFEARGIRYHKHSCEGHGHLPTDDQINDFVELVHEFTQDNPDKLIGVHCTHGLNRTGYLICKYLMMKLGMDGKQALRAFEYSRGHQIERAAYIKDLTGEDVDIQPLEELRDSPPRDSNDQPRKKERWNRARRRARREEREEQEQRQEPPRHDRPLHTFDQREYPSLQMPFDNSYRSHRTRSYERPSDLRGHLSRNRLSSSYDDRRRDYRDDAPSYRDNWRDHRDSRSSRSEYEENRRDRDSYDRHRYRTSTR